MSCLNINISRVLTPSIKATMSRVGGVSAFVSMLPNMSISISSLSSRLNVSVGKVDSEFDIAIAEISKRMEISYSIICDVPNGGYFLFVEPEVVWLTEANGWSQDFVVKSNVDWTIDY